MKSHILIVDDDTAIRDSLYKFLEHAGFVVKTTYCAEEALEFLQKNTFSIVLADIKLPGLNGLELTESITKDFDTDVIVMTGYSIDYSYEEAIQKGASDFVFKPIRFEELLLRLKRVLKERKTRIEHIRMMEKLQMLAITDGLTKLYNSRYFYSQLEIEINRSNRYNHPLSLLLLDLDHFKQYNDVSGHLEGDKILYKLGQIIISCLRKMDTAYRYGGEEFTIILPETNGKEAKAVAERIKAAVENTNFPRNVNKTKPITVSVGATEYCQTEQLSDFVKRADKAMYTSKKKGRNRVSYLFAK